MMLAHKQATDIAIGQVVWGLWCSVGTGAAVTPPFRLGDPALCGSHIL